MMGEKRAVQVSHELWRQVMTQGAVMGARCIEGIPEDAVLVGYFYASHFAPTDEPGTAEYKNYPDACFVFESDSWIQPAQKYMVTDPHTSEVIHTISAVFQVAECRTCKQSESDPALISLGSAQASHLCLWLDKYFKPDFGCTQYEPRETDD